MYQLGGVRVSFRGCMIIVDHNLMGFHQLVTRAQALAIKAMGATLDYIKNIT